MVFVTVPIALVDFAVLITEPDGRSAADGAVDGLGIPFVRRV